MTKGEEELDNQSNGGRVDFANRGFSSGEGRTGDLTEVARAIEVFLVQEGSTDKDELGVELVCR